MTIWNVSVGSAPPCILIIVQRGATQSSLLIILQGHSTCFGYQPHPSSGIHKTVTTASGTGHAVLCSYIPPTWPRWREVAAQKIWPVPEAVVTVVCTPDDGCGWHPKHVEWTCRIINKLLCVASRWTIININIMKVIEAFLEKANVLKTMKKTDNLFVELQSIGRISGAVLLHVWVL